MFKAQVAIMVIASVAAAGCASRDDSYSEAVGAVMAGSGSSYPSPDAAIDSGSGSGSSTIECGDGLTFLDPYSAQYNYAGDTVSLASHSVTGTAPFTFAATGLPPGLSINASDGTISGTLTASSYVGSPYAVTATVTDSSSPAVVKTVTFNWRVDRKSIGMPSQQNTAGDTVNVSLPAAPGQAPFVYVVTGLPPGLTPNMMTGAITGTIPVGTTPGSFIVSVTTTGGPVTESYTFMWWVWGPSQQVAVEPADQTSWENEEALLKLPQPNGTGDFTYAVANLPPGLALDAATRMIQGVVLPGAGAPSGQPYEVTITATSSDGIATTFRFRWTVYAESLETDTPTPTPTTTTFKLNTL